MSLAIKRLKNLGWMALVCLVAILLYPLSLNVATLHSDLVKIDRQIIETKREIDFLEAELRTRANLGQLEEWNELLYGYRPPTAEQFLDGENALADLDRKDKTRPVYVAAAIGGDGPAGIIGSGIPSEEAGEKPLSESEEQSVAELRGGAPVVSGDEDRTERLAKMEEQLLSDEALDEIENQSREEKAGR